MTIDELLRDAAARLKAAGIDNPSGEAELLLAQALRMRREALLALPKSSVVKMTQVRHFDESVKRRAGGEPFAYIAGEKWFYGRRFMVTKDVLIPRPATETMIDVILSEAKTGAQALHGTQGIPRLAARPRNSLTVLDIGCGSGAIGLTLAAELPGAAVVCADASLKALAVARKNARGLGVASRVSFARLDILRPRSLRHIRSRRPMARPSSRLRRAGNGQWSVIAANLPYLPDKILRSASPEVRREPRLALASGQGGLRHYRALMSRIRETAPPRLLILEAEPYQMKALRALVRAALPEHRIEIRKDLGGLPRVLAAKTRN